MANILLVDTSAVSRVIAVKGLEEDGHCVTETANGREALEICRKSPPDCVITDLVLQELDGFKVIRAINDENLRIPVIVLTSVRTQSIREKCSELGVAAFVTKPPMPLTLCERVNEVLKTGQKGEKAIPQP